MDKRTILLFLMPERGALNASFVLANDLRTNGYEVIYVSTSERFNEHICRQGFGYRTFSFSKHRVFNKVHTWVDDIDSFEDWIDEVSPALILLDPLVTIGWYPFLRVLLKKHIPTLNLNTTLSSVSDCRTPPVFSHRIPRDREGLFQQIANRCLWFETHCEFFVRRLKPGVKGRRWTEGLKYALGWRAMITSIKKEIRQYGHDLLWGEYDYRLDVPDLVMAPRELDFPGAIADRSRCYIGSCVYESRQEWEFDWEQIEDKPIIYCSLGTYCGSYPSAKKLFAAVSEVAKIRASFQFIVQVGVYVDDDDFKRHPRNLVFTQYVPQLEILKKAKIFITHGGFSSMREGAYFGVPMIVFPCWFDQPGNAARIVYHDLGVRGNIEGITPHALNGLLDQVLNSETLPISTKQMKDALQLQRDCRIGVKFVNSVIGGA